MPHLPQYLHWTSDKQRIRKEKSYHKIQTQYQYDAQQHKIQEKTGMLWLYKNNTDSSLLQCEHVSNMIFGLKIIVGQLINSQNIYDNLKTKYYNSFEMY